MADFSKEYCEKYDPDMPWDFSIEKTFNELSENNMIGIICEGYGFIGIGKVHDKCILYFRDWLTMKIDEVPLEQLTEYYEQNIRPRLSNHDKIGILGNRFLIKKHEHY